MKASEYLELIDQFLGDNFTNAEDFAKLYDQIFLSESEMNDELFKILNDFWMDIEAYSPWWEPEDIDELHITEETLRNQSMITRERIKKYLEINPE